MIVDITGITPEQAIRNAFKWCLDKGLITNPNYIK
nr:MAG TPA: Int protein [Crassvirales sp.]